ncbi:MAG: hypothetical protein JO332_13495, partial [Planctomycetaceae bacterium]|nr:hypothetical protein [Planctomycetaceae bacterium]
MKRMTLTCAVLLLTLASTSGAQEAPAERTPWTASKILGSPEPPPALRSERVFPKLTFKAPVQLIPFPDRRRYVLVEEHGGIYSFRNDPACEKADLLIDMRKEIR